MTAGKDYHSPPDGPRILPGHPGADHQRGGTNLETPQTIPPTRNSSLSANENVETKSAEIYTAPNNPVELIIPECTALKEDIIVWKTGEKGSILLAKWKDKPLYYTECLNKACDLQENGVLTLRAPNRETTKYIVTVHTKEGVERCTREVTVMVQDPVSEPLLNVSCLPEGGSNISCRIITGTDPRFSITVNGSLLVNSTSSSSIDVNEVSVLVASPGPWDITCSVRNGVSDNETKITGENCPVPPSVPVLVGWCLPDGRQEVSCSVENGSDPVFSLSVNGELLRKVRKEHKRVNVTLSSSGPWDVNCSVRNELGEKKKNETFKTCPGPPSLPVLLVSCQDGGSEISCFVEKGMILVFSLTVNGELLENVTRAEKRVNVTLFSSGPWDVHCSVRNDLGNQNKTEILECPVPVSVPVLNVSCHHDGSVRGVCSVEVGTNVSYTWSVNGEIITGNTGPNLTINSAHFSSGAINISCSVENSISKEQSNVTYIDCGDPCLPCLRNSIIGGSVALIVTLSALCIASYYMDRNRRED